MSRTATMSIPSGAPAACNAPLPLDLRRLAEALGHQVAFGFVEQSWARSAIMALIQTFARGFPHADQRLVRHIWFLDCTTLLAEAAYDQEVNFEVEFHEARLSVGPCLARGGSNAQATAIASARAPHLAAEDIALIVDEEAAWWIRHRHERGYAGIDAVAA